MRARAAYISSFGTSGILIASALLVLAMVSALVAFRGWPGGDASSSPVASVPVAPSAVAPRVVDEPRTAASTTRAGGASSRGATSRSAGATRSTSTAGLYKDTSAIGVAGGTVDGMIKVPPAAPPAPVPFPPPSTGPQQETGTIQSPARRSPPADDPKEPLLPDLPAEPMPDPLPLPSELQGTLGDGSQLPAAGEDLEPVAIGEDGVAVDLGESQVTVPLR